MSFSRKKEDRKPHEVILENSLYTILRDARSDAARQVPIIGAEAFIEDCLDILQGTSARIPDPLQDIQYRVFRGGLDDSADDVMIFLPVRGNANIFMQIGTLYRTQGLIGTEGRGILTLHYRSAIFQTPSDLQRLFLDDVEVLRRYLQDVDADMEHFRAELLLQLRSLISDLPTAASPRSDLMVNLEKLGFKRRH